MLRQIIFGLVLVMAVAGISSQVRAQAAKQAVEDPPESGLRREDVAIPRQLLGLFHAPEIHRELKLTPSQLASLEGLFKKIDGDWFRARIYPASEQKEAIDRCEGELRKWIAGKLTDAQQKRAQQLELRAQGVRMLLRQDLAESLRLEPSQIASLVAAAGKADQAASRLFQATIKGESNDALREELKAAQTAEQKGPETVLRPDQLKSLAGLIGDSFDTSKLTRIFPLAPELVPVEDWINSKPIRLADLRGKVVVVHFYAFQCINCQRNLPHYAKWARDFKDKDVVLIGIQTPETESERDVQKVRAAARDAHIEYPVLIDLESKNWKEWSNTMWPTVYVIDRQGYLRQWWQGELNYNGATGEQQFHDLITRLLDEPG